MNLHAAGLTDDRGRVLALVAASGTGKTTAARILGRHLGYLSDETISVGAELEVLPYAEAPVRGARRRPAAPQGAARSGRARPARAARPAPARRLVILDRVAASEPHGVDRSGWRRRWPW